MKTVHVVPSAEDHTIDDLTCWCCPVYMDEDTREPNAGFEPLRTHFAELMQVLADYVRQQMARG